jgi:serine/threonine-protein kinase
MKRALPLNCLGALALMALATSTGALANTIYIDDGSNITRYAATPSGSATPINPPLATNTGPGGLGLAFNSQDDLFETNYDTSSIYEYSLTGVRSTFVSAATDAAFVDPEGIAINGAGDVFVGNNDGSEIDAFGPGGGLLYAPITAGVSQVGSLAVDALGDLFEADAGSFRINEFLAGGGTKTVATDLNGANFYGLAVDAVGDVFVSYWNMSVGTGGGIYEIAAGTSTVASFYSSSTLLPTGLAYDQENGDLYMAYVDSIGGANNGGADYFTSLAVPATPGAAQPGVLVANNGLNEPYSIAYLTPEPGTIGMLLGGLACLPLLRRRAARK